MWLKSSIPVLMGGKLAGGSMRIAQGNVCPLSTMKSDALTTWCAAWKPAQIGFLLKCCCSRPWATWVAWQRKRKGTFIFANICQEYMCKSYRAAYHMHGLPGFLRVLLPTPNYRINLYQPLDACLWMDHTKPEHPSPSFIYFNWRQELFFRHLGPWILWMQWDPNTHDSTREPWKRMMNTVKLSGSKSNTWLLFRRWQQILKYIVC